ncbi:iron-containing redox enzyme family protein [Cylindrospermum sp. FACHB-282]|uniref:iron-containing redox enzyme family protein n=1 Tax=Cylindrospermum sp. FACHB-282 TaxID=2692794 RepID=UPI001685F303|nr:iron-containing redox enzyme family protein [Cylindrospermum sp. FACHB-282]MBD2383912.1 iron-containing redox enzyme family protein [Cylindrospermum sp. FACHB-282]
MINFDAMTDETITDERKYFYWLMNIDEMPEFLPKAKNIADAYLKAGEERMLDDSNQDFPKLYRFFDYTPEAFDERLQKIYDGLVKDYAEFNLDEALKVYTRSVLIERLRNFAPFNLTDGAWLQRVAGAGTSTDVESLLFSIWSDEVGNGDPTKNHSNVYKTLLNSLNVEMPSEASYPFVKQENLFDSAFTNPTFQLAVSQFPKTFFPELIGMTLYLEWESTPSIAPLVKILERRDINPQFFSLHVAIDNPSSGHGAIAKQAVERYLDEIRQSSGEKEVQEQWRRIWIGYVTFATTGTLGEDLAKYFASEAQKTPKKKAQDKMIALIKKKAPFASTIHDGKSVHSKLINQWFSDPQGFVKALETSSYVEPGSASNSQFMRLLAFDGPMYKIFTEAEIEIIKEWILTLKEQPPSPTPPVEDSAEKMKQLIINKGEFIEASGGDHHGSRSLSDNGTTKRVDEWFQEPIPFMKAMVNNNFVNTTDVESSRLIELITARGMAGVFSNDEVETIRQWIRDGAKIPDEEVQPVAPPIAPTTLFSESIQIASRLGKRVHRILGQGTVN